MNKKVIKKIALILIPIVVFFGLYLYIGMILTPKSQDDLGGEKYYNAVAYKYEDKNSIDVMLYGNSDLYSGYSSMEVYDEHGITSFGCGAAKQTLHSIYKQIKKTFKRQSPKVVVLEGDCLYQKNGKSGGSTVYNYAPVVSPVLYHARWKELKWRDFVTLPKTNSKKNFMKGYNFSNKVSNYEVKADYMGDVDSKPQKMAKSIMKDFDKIYKLCKKNNAELMIMTIPTPYTWTCAKQKGVQQLVDKYNKKDKNYQVKFLDMNGNLEGFDYSKHFKDNGNHCNYFGAKVVSHRVGEFLTENYALTDRRGNDKYKTWDSGLAKYKKYIERNI